MHIRSILTIAVIGIIFVPAATAQKRTFATINPNSDTVNKSADLYFPQSGEFSPAAGNMNIPRENHVAVTLNSGKVLIAGGYNNRYLKSAELFDPATGLFTQNLQTTLNEGTGLLETTEGNLNRARSGAAAVLLPDGKVFIVGGYDGSYLASAEIYDPSTGEFELLANQMNDARHNPNAILLADGRVFVSGGFNGAFLSSIEVFDPVTRRFYDSPDMNYARDGHTTTLLDNGNVLIVGGCANAESNRIICDEYIDVVEILDTDSGYSELEGLNTPRAGHTASLLPDGRVLIAGGMDAGGFLASAEIYDPADDSFTQIADMDVARYEHTATTLAGGEILLAGGHSGAAAGSAEIYDPATGSFSPASSVMSVPKFRHTENSLNDGRILLAGGLNSELLVFDVNVRSMDDNISPNIVFYTNPVTEDVIGFVPYTGSGVILAFSSTTGEVLEKIVTGGKPSLVTPLQDGNTLAVVSVFDNRIFLINMNTLELQETFTFEDAQFGFGSILTLSPDGSLGYISSTGTGEVIKFDIETGSELQRLADLEIPAQITVTPDGGTLLVVEVSTAQLYFVDTATMTTKFTVTPRTVYDPAGFSIFNKPVLSPDGRYGIIGSQDIDTNELDAIFYFNTSTGDIPYILITGSKPAFTTLSPDNDYWLVLTTDKIAKIPVDDPLEIENMETTVLGVPAGSANVVFSGDSRYIFYALSSLDRVLQLDLQSNGVVGYYLVGDRPSVSKDQPSSIAITPNGETIAVLNFASNELELMTDASVLRVPEFVNGRDRFTGLTLINLSGNTANLEVTPVTNFGGDSFKLADGTISRINPVAFPPLAPNEQLSVELAQIFDFDNSEDNQGHLYISSDQPGIVGFAVTGTIQASFLEAHLTGLDGMSLYTFPDQLHDWIMPDIPAQNTAPPELSLINPNFNATDFETVHYGADGSMLEAESADLDAAYRKVIPTDELFYESQLGQVLIAGGRLPLADRASEIYEPDSGNFLAGGVMIDARYGHAAVLLASGKVLMSGGRDGAGIHKSAELYDPIDMEFVPVIGTMVRPRYRHTATLLNNGNVLVAGGQNSVSINNTAELYDPVSETFSRIDDFMNSPRDAHTATRLPDGNVLLAGGIDGVGLSNTAEIYNPVTSEFSPTGLMNTERAFHQAVLLKSGQVLITGGYNGDYLSSAEIYDPATGTFTEIPSMNVERGHHTATLLSDGQVLIAGGTNSSGVLDSVEMYVPYANRFFLLGTELKTARTRHTATLLPSGDVLIVSGTDGEDAVASSEIFASNTLVFQELTSSQLFQWDHTSTLLQDLIAGYVRGSSSIGMMFRGRYRNTGAETTINGIDVEKFEGITEVYSPQFVTLLPDRTLLNLINANDDNDAIVRIILHDTGGDILAEEIRLLPVNHQINDDLLNIFPNNPEIQGQEGWIEVYSDVDRIVGTVSFIDDENIVMTTHELSGTPLNEFVFPLAAEDSQDYLTELSLLNPNNQSAHVEIEYRDSNGTVVHSTAFELAAETRRSETLSDYFGMSLDRLYGYIYVRSGLDLYGISVLKDRDGKFGCAVPPIPVPVTVPEP